MAKDYKDIVDGNLVIRDSVIVNSHFEGALGDERRITGSNPWDNKTVESSKLAQTLQSMIGKHQSNLELAGAPELSDQVAKTHYTTMVRMMAGMMGLPVYEYENEEEYKLAKAANIHPKNSEIEDCILLIVGSEYEFVRTIPDMPTGNFGVSHQRMQLQQQAEIARIQSQIAAQVDTSKPNNDLLDALRYGHQGVSKKSDGIFKKGG